MSDGFQILLDAPAEAKQRLQVATLGTGFKDGRYGEFDITADDVASWRDNLSKLPGGRALIDVDHSADRSPRRTEAAGWITNVELEDGVPVADVEWTPVGEQAIADKRYLFFSPTYGPFKDERGTVHDNTLVGGALTNKPFLTQMPTLTLASEETLQAAADADHAEAQRRLLDALTSKQRDNLDASDFAIPEDRAYPVHDLSHARNALARASGKPEESRVKAAVYKKFPQLKPSAQGGSDTRRSMDTEVLKALDLDTDADDTKVLEAIAALKQKADAEPEPTPEPVTKTLEQQAADDGKVLLDAERLTTLMADAKAGADAKRELHEQRFETALTRALENQDGAKVTPAEKEDLHALYQLDSGRVLKMIDEREPIVQAKPSGDPTIQLDADTDPDTLRAHGIHPDNHQLHQEVLKRLKDAGKPMTEYPKMLEQVIGAEA